MTEQDKKLSEVAKILQANAKREADAIEFYTLQLELIEEAISIMEEGELKELLKSLYSETEEKISDELNHSASLVNEYVQLTGINIAED